MKYVPPLKKMAKEEKMPDVSLLELFGIFFYVGLFTIGGGLVAITLMQQMIVERGLISSQQFYNMIAVSESTPGPIGINMATFLGFEFYGVPGAVLTTVAEVLPSIIAILIIARFLTAFKDRPLVRTVFVSLRPAATGLVLVAAVNIFSLAILNLPSSPALLFKEGALKNLFDWKNLAFYVPALALSFATRIHPVIVVALGAVFGMIFL